MALVSLNFISVFFSADRLYSNQKCDACIPENPGAFKNNLAANCMLILYSDFKKTEKRLMKIPIKDQVKVVAEHWIESPYYSDAEKWTFLFWDSDTVFRKLFDRMDHRILLELACGWGRHTEKCIDMCEGIIIMDVVEENLNKTMSRLSTHSNISRILGDGFTFNPIEDSTLTAIFCYDAMVHFSPDIVESYLVDGSRVLRENGMMVLHHSNYETTSDQHYGLNPHARNHMPYELFESFCNKSGFRIVESVVIPWGGVPELDRVSLVQKVGK